MEACSAHIASASVHPSCSTDAAVGAVSGLLNGSPCPVPPHSQVLWEIVTGERPQRGSMRPPAVPQECPAQVADLIQRCTTLDPDQRPTALEVMRELAALSRPSARAPTSTQCANSTASPCDVGSSPCLPGTAAAVLATAPAVQQQQQRAAHSGPDCLQELSSPPARSPNHLQEPPPRALQDMAPASRAISLAWADSDWPQRTPSHLDSLKHMRSLQEGVEC